MTLLSLVMDFGHGNQSVKNASAEAEPILNADPCQSSSLSGDIENKERSRSDSHSAIEGVSCDGIENSVSPHSAVSSSSESDCTVAEDDLELIPKVFPNSNNNDAQISPGSEKNVELHGREVNDVSTAALLSMEKVYGYSDSISEVSCSDHPSPLPVLSPTRPPPFQTMERSEGYDPSRIPASIFISGTSTPKEWSVNSNDSLFSIGIGRNSVAREQFAGAESSNSQDLIAPEESQKWKPFHGSGELSRPKELHSSPAVKTSNKVTLWGETSPMSKEKKVKQKRLDLRKNRTLLKGQPKNIPSRNIGVEGKTNEGRKNRDEIQHSVENRTNNQSSVSPINKEPSKMPCCQCSSNCSCCRVSSRPCRWFCCMFSSNCNSECCSRSPCWSCKWSCPPSSCCKCPSCSKCSCSPTLCCKRLSCCPCSKCSFSPSCCCKWPSCSSCCSFKCHFPDCSYRKCITYCCSCKGLKGCRRKKCCSCPICCRCCSSCC